MYHDIATGYLLNPFFLNVLIHHDIDTGYLLNSNVFLMNSKTVVMQLPSHVAMAASSRAVFSSICLYHSKQHGCAIPQDHHL